MTTEAIVMMLVMLLTVWGGLGVAIWNLMTRSPESGITAADSAAVADHRDL